MATATAVPVQPTGPDTFSTGGRSEISDLMNTYRETHSETRCLEYEGDYDGPPSKKRKTSNACVVRRFRDTSVVGLDNCNISQDPYGRTTIAQTAPAKFEVHIGRDEQSTTVSELDMSELSDHVICPGAVNYLPNTSCPLANLEDTAYGDVAGYNGKNAEHHEEHTTFMKTESADTSLANTAQFDSAMVCYGMLNDLDFKNTAISSTAECMPAQWDGSLYLQDAWSGDHLAELSEYTHQLLTTLASQAQVSFQFWLRPSGPQDTGSPTQQRTASDGKVAHQQSLSAIVYGPLHMAIIVGDWLNIVKIYLQMPRGCFLDVQYKNPHCLSFDDKPASTTGDLKLMDVFPRCSSDDLQQEDFAGLYTDDVYDEAQQPARISSPLHSHQRVALSFLIKQESGWDCNETKAGIWKQKLNSFGATKYQNILTGKVQGTLPNEFRGGILADEMGLGKTCTMLALIAADLEALAATERKQDGRKGLGSLIIVPFALLQVWEKQILQHFFPDCVKWKILHGPSRKVAGDELRKFDIVITTYNTVALEWRQHKSSRHAVNKSELFSAQWRRIVLDEAHVIRNKATVISKAVCALASDRRWCITGTPIQNRLGDLYGLLRFLNLEPYNQFKEFENDFLRPWRSHNDKVALKRLLYLMKAIAIRRPRSIISLPDRHEIIAIVDFSAEERTTYESAREGVIEFLDAAAASHQSVASTYINAFQRINEMRHVCNHGTRPSRRHDATINECSKNAAASDSMLDDFEDLVEANGSNCVLCGTDLQEENEDDENLLKAPTQMSKHVPDMISRQTCKACLQQSIKFGLSPSISRHSTTIGDSPSPPPPAFHRSSKIASLLNQICLIPAPEKIVVFSYWTSTLAAISQALSEASIPSVQYDGPLTRVRRNQALADFATNPSIRVMLISITCGGQGLDLTAANHAFLFEPQWNPMLEEQAMSRVHRLGQTKPVRLVRFVVRGTWEEKIRVLQERKRNLVDLIVEKRNLKDGDEGRKQLHFLRELIT